MVGIVAKTRMYFVAPPAIFVVGKCLCSVHQSFAQTLHVWYASEIPNCDRFIDAMHTDSYQKLIKIHVIFDLSYFLTFNISLYHYHILKKGAKSGIFWVINSETFMLALSLLLKTFIFLGRIPCRMPRLKICQLL